MARSPARLTLALALAFGSWGLPGAESRAYAHDLSPLPGVVPDPCIAAYPPSHYRGWAGLPAYAAFPGRPTPSYMGSLGYLHAPAWYRPGGRRVGLTQYLFGGYSGVLRPW